MIDPNKVASVSVHPAFGVARVGNAPEEFYPAPEVPGASVDTIRADNGDIMRQAARFRIYAHMKDGSVQRLTLNEPGVSIEWRVELANLKAGWYRFETAGDLPDFMARDSARRNAGIQGPARAALDVTPSPQRISGKDQPGVAFDDGDFFGRRVYLGELRTDADGQLVVLGGHGDSAPRDPGTRATTFANNDLWHDDVADGPVRAAVTIGNASFEADPGYVIVAPPNYAPQVFGVVTMDDVARETYMDEGWLQRPAETSFTRDIWPIFARMTGQQWVNHGIYILLGAGSPLDAYDPTVIERLRDPSPAAAAFRKSVLALFREPGDGPADPPALPPIYGDTFDDFSFTRHYDLSVTPTMWAHLKRWAAGDFANDWSGIPAVPAFEDLSAEAQVEALDRAGLHECLGGPFHPGIEVSWPMRSPQLWSGPYRLNLIAEGEKTRQDYGDTLTGEIATAANGPNAAAGPGALTRWLGIPWQTDEASCNSGALYDRSDYIATPSFWGARVPNQVLSADGFARVSDPATDPAQRMKHFSHRLSWIRDLGQRYQDRINDMVREWWMLGAVEPRELPEDLARASGLPRVVLVETGRSAQGDNVDPTFVLSTAIDRLDAITAGEPAPARASVAPEKRHARRRYGRGEV